MNQGKYLNEENYNKMSKKLKMISLAILLLGLTIGGLLIGYSLIKSHEGEVENKRLKEAALVKAKEKAAAAEERLKEIKEEENNLKVKYAEKQQECDSIDMNSEKWIATKTRCDQEVAEINSELSDLESEKLRLKQTDYEAASTPEYIETANYIPLYFFDAYIIVGSLMISLFVFLFAKRRAIMAYSIQTAIPVAKEATEQYTPTAAKAAGDIATSVAEGITRGIKKGKDSK